MTEGARDELARLRRQLRDTVQAIQELVPGGVDAVVDDQGTYHLLPSAQDALIASELDWRTAGRTMRAILDALPANLTLLDADGNILAVNAPWRRFASDNGLAVPETWWIDKSYFDVCAKSTGADRATASAASEAIRAALAGSEGEHMEYPCHSPDEKRWFRMVASHARLGDADGGAVVMHIDITDRVEAELALHQRQEQLRREKERFQQLANHIEDVFFIREPESGEVSYVSPAYEALWGRSCASVEVDPGSFLGAIHKNDAATVSKHLAAVARGERREQRYRVVRPDGEVRWVHETAYPVLSDDGDVEQVVGTVRDVSESHRTERLVARQAALLDQASDAIIVCDDAWRVQYWSGRASVMYGYDGDEVMGRSLRSVTGVDPERADMLERELRERGEGSHHAVHRHRDGKALTVFARWTTVVDAEGGSSVLAIHSDVTVHKELEAQLFRAQRLESIGTLAGGIAHDLNNVLAPILMALEALRGDLNAKERGEIVDHLEKTAKRGADLVRQVLTFSRGSTVERGVVDVQALAEEVARICRETFPRDIVIDLVTPKDTWPVAGDATQVHQILMNLCVNARDAMPEGGRLSIALDNQTVDRIYAKMNPDADPGSYVVIRVSDTGVGMPKEVVERIFEPFFTTKEVGAGTGLGLSTSFTIARDHGGFIHVYSEEGKGSEFRVYLPAATHDDLALRAEAMPEALPRGDGELVLVVDDEEGIRQIAKRTLERFGYRVVVAANGAEAVGIYAQRRAEIAVVLSDMSMPVMDGPTMIQALRVIHPDVVVVGSSGLQSHGLTVRAASAGVASFIPKPYTAATLLRALAQALGKVPPRITSKAPPGAPKPVSAPRGPSARAEPSESKAPAEEPGSPEPRAPVILVVDDEAPIVALLKRTLARHGYEVLGAESGEEALAIIQQPDRRIDLVMSDLQMEGIDGVELLGRIAEVSPHTPVMIMTGDLQSPRAIRALEAGAKMIAKPFDPLSLPRQVAEALDLARE